MTPPHPLGEHLPPATIAELLELLSTHDTTDDATALEEEDTHVHPDPPPRLPHP